MKTYLGDRRLQLLCVAVVGFAAGVIVSSCKPANGDNPPPAPRNVTARGLIENPGYYTGVVVRVRMTGVWKGMIPSELVFHAFAGDPPAVVFRFGTTDAAGVFRPAPAPDPIPDHVVGLCVGIEGRGVVVLNCRPD